MTFFVSALHKGRVAHSDHKAIGAASKPRSSLNNKNSVSCFTFQPSPRNEFPLQIGVSSRLLKTNVLILVQLFRRQNETGKRQQILINNVIPINEMALQNNLLAQPALADNRLISRRQQTHSIIHNAKFSVQFIVSRNRLFNWAFLVSSRYAYSPKDEKWSFFPILYPIRTSLNGSYYFITPVLFGKFQEKHLLF